MRNVTLIFAACLLLAAGAPPAGRAQTAEAPAELSTPRRIETEFLKGLWLLETGDARAAAIIFRRILAEDPDLPRVRLELARALFVLESWSESRAEFVAVLSGDVPVEVKRNILKFINAIDARRGFDWNAAVGVSLGPEAGRSYETDTVFLEFLGVVLPFTVEREEQEGFGVTFEGSAELRRGLYEFGEGGPAVVGFATGAADIFDAAGAKSDDTAFAGALGARVVWPQTTANLAANASVRHKGGDPYENRFGASGVVEYRSESGFAPIASASYASVNIHDSELQDGDLFGVGAGFTKSVFGAATVGAFVTAERFDAASEHESYDALELRLVAAADVGAGVNATAEARLRRTSYDAKAPLFLDRRVDDQIALDLELVKRDFYVFENFSPFVRVGYTWQDSTIGIYSYGEYRVFVGLRNAF